MEVDSDYRCEAVPPRCPEDEVALVPGPGDVVHAGHDLS